MSDLVNALHLCFITASLIFMGHRLADNVDSIAAMFQREQKEDERVTCKICYNKAKDCVFGPCMHTACLGCAEKWMKANKTCPECRCRVAWMKKIYL